mmetsp:Transcript_13766/g.32361  ORF Transcript_13766/g.32361 Transcript_13766/m.32361 type:complete len:903 (+) Transcript_13766:131-2839(+)
MGDPSDPTMASNSAAQGPTTLAGESCPVGSLAPPHQSEEDVNKERFLFMLTVCIGRTVRVLLVNKTWYVGVLQSCAWEQDNSLVLCYAQEANSSTQQTEVIPTLIIPGSEVSILEAEVPEDPNEDIVSTLWDAGQSSSASSGLKAPVRQDNCNVVALPNPSLRRDGHRGEKPAGEFNQLELVSTNAENLYMTKVDPSMIPQSKRQQAEALARQIEAAVASGVEPREMEDLGCNESETSERPGPAPDPGQAVLARIGGVTGSASARFAEIAGLHDLSRTGKVTDQRAARRLNALNLELPHMQMMSISSQPLQPLVSMQPQRQSQQQEQGSQLQPGLQQQQQQQQEQETRPGVEAGNAEYGGNRSNVFPPSTQTWKENDGPSPPLSSRPGRMDVPAEDTGAAAAQQQPPRGIKGTPNLHNAELGVPSQFPTAADGPPASPQQQHLTKRQLQQQQQQAARGAATLPEASAANGNNRRQQQPNANMPNLALSAAAEEQQQQYAPNDPKASQSTNQQQAPLPPTPSKGARRQQQRLERQMQELETQSVAEQPPQQVRQQSKQQQQQQQRQPDFYPRSAWDASQRYYDQRHLADGKREGSRQHSDRKKEERRKKRRSRSSSTSSSGSSSTGAKKEKKMAKATRRLARGDPAYKEFLQARSEQQASDQLRQQSEALAAAMQSCFTETMKAAKVGAPSQEQPAATAAAAASIPWQPLAPWGQMSGGLPPMSSAGIGVHPMQMSMAHQSLQPGMGSQSLQTGMANQALQTTAASLPGGQSAAPMHPMLLGAQPANAAAAAAATGAATTTPQQTPSTPAASTGTTPALPPAPPAAPQLTPTQAKTLEASLSHKVVFTSLVKADVVAVLCKALGDRQTASQTSDFIKRHGKGCKVPRALADRAEKAADLAMRM